MFEATRRSPAPSSRLLCLGFLSQSRKAKRGVTEEVVPGVPSREGQSLPGPGRRAGYGNASSPRWPPLGRGEIGSRQMLEISQAPKGGQGMSQGPWNIGAAGGGKWGQDTGCPDCSFLELRRVPGAWLNRQRGGHSQSGGRKKGQAGQMRAHAEEGAALCAGDGQTQCGPQS